MGNGCQDTLSVYRILSAHSLNQAPRWHAPLACSTVKVGHLEPLPRCHPLAGPLQSGQGSLPDLSGGANRSLAPERDDAADQDED